MVNHKGAKGAKEETLRLAKSFALYPWRFGVLSHAIGVTGD
jgi:hypothetical protein